jgi:ketosteroid isomerase-like protein
MVMEHERSRRVKTSLLAAGFAVAASQFALGQARDEAGPGAGVSKDEAAIRKILEGWERPEEYFGDVDWENSFGVRRRGSAAVDQFVQERVRPTLATAEIATLEVKLLFVTPDVAVVDRYWRVVGQTDRSGTSRSPDRHGRTTYVLRRHGERWSVAVERVADLRK